jgi:hypothetical protein
MNLQLFAWEKDCGCGLLAPGTKIDAPVWTLDPQFLPKIAAAVKFVGNHTKRFVLSALYFGESAATEIAIPVREMCTIIHDNHLRNGFRYIVGGRARSQPAN